MESRGSEFFSKIGFAEGILLFLLKLTTLSYTWLLLPIEVQFCNFQREGLEDFTVNVQMLFVVKSRLFSLFGFSLLLKANL